MTNSYIKILIGFIGETTYLTEWIKIWINITKTGKKLRNDENY